MRSLPVVVLIALALGGAWFAFRGTDQESPPASEQRPEPLPSAAPEAGPKPLTGTAPERRPAPVPTTQRTEGYIEFPDGTFYPPLNGVKIAPKPLFHPRMAPFAKVVGIERDARGRDWYVHENGTRSTVFINSAGVATYDVEKPTAPLPTLPDEIGEGAAGTSKK
jgi:hypothetical protein